MRNNQFYDDGRANYANGAYAIYIRANAGMVKIFNNTVRDVWAFVEIEGSPSGVEIRGNIHRDAASSYQAVPKSVYTTSSGVIVSDNNFEYSIAGGVQSNNINSNPLFITGPNGEINWLNTTSPSRNVGPADALFNDIDGSRNDQGAYGGHSYDPTGRTTLKPVVLSGDVNPLYVKRGGAVTIKARAAVSAAP